MIEDRYRSSDTARLTLYVSQHVGRAAQSNREEKRPAFLHEKRGEKTYARAKRQNGQKRAERREEELRFAIDDPDFYLAAIEIAHLSNISPIGLPIYGDADDIDFTRDIARTDFPGILTSRGDFLGGIGPARESNPLLRTFPSVAIPLGRLNSSHRMGCTFPTSRKIKEASPL